MDPVNPELFQNGQIHTSSLPKAEEVEFTGLSPKYLLKKNISTGISLVIFLCFAGFAYIFFLPFFNGFFPIVPIALFLLFFWSFFSNYQWQKRSGYAIRERDIIYMRGFLYQKVTVVPFSRVQHVSTSRGFLDKALGLSTLEIFTAGGSGSDISIPGLTPELAASLKESLSARISSHV